MESQCTDSIKSSDTLSFLPKKLKNNNGYVKTSLHIHIHVYIYHVSATLHCVCACIYVYMYVHCMCTYMYEYASCCRFTVEGDLAHRTFHVSLCGHNSHCGQDTSICYIDNIGETHDVASFTHQTIMTQGTCMVHTQVTVGAGAVPVCVL